MTNSHLLGLVTFGGLALFALLAWVVADRHPDVARDPAMRRRTRITAVGLLVLGVLFGGLAFSIDNNLRVTTLHEEMVEGSAVASAAADPGGAAPERVVAFTVEHPGVAHDLFLSPTADSSQTPDADAEVAFSLHGPGGDALLPERSVRFAVRPETRNARADWDGRSYPFTPTEAGPHEVRVRTLTPGVPRVQVRIADPLKRDGKRMPGY
jgi:hypothetical protein